MAASNKKDWTTYFRAIIANRFPNLTIDEEVPVSQVAEEMYEVCKRNAARTYQAYKAEWGAPYTFVLSSEGIPRCILMLADWAERPENKVKYLISKMFAKKMNIPYLYFYTNMKNEESYCIKRICEAMK